MPRLIGATLHLADQRPPFIAGAAVIVPVGSRVLAAVIEELDIVPFERLDLRFDKCIKLSELVGDLLREFEIHGASPVSVLVGPPDPLERDPAMGMGAA